MYLVCAAIGVPKIKAKSSLLFFKFMCLMLYFNEFYFLSHTLIFKKMATYKLHFE